jgi:eukaryotic-like serine/threonine-protein kinase
MSEAPSAIGRYQVKRWIASGAMGEVYEAYDPIIDRPVAIKIIRRELIERDDSADRLERFRREARAAGGRMHPNIVTILDFGEHDGIPYLAMEYVAGENVDAALKRSGPFDPTRAVSIVIQVLSALEFAHSNGVIHRDIKPSNILLAESGPIKVADFGIARLEASELTIDGDMLGTPSYMAPEQLAGGAVDHRADLFSTGLLSYEMLTGEKAFRRNVFELARTMRDRAPLGLWVKYPEISLALAAIINRALAFDPDQRYANAAAFAGALRTVSSSASELISEHHADATLAVAPPLAAQAPPIVQPLPEISPSPPAQEAPRTAGLAAEALAAITHDLATFIGPLARIAVRRAAAQCSDIGLLYRELAKQIDHEADRAAFIAKSRDRAQASSRTGSNAPPSRDTGSSERDGASPAIIPPDVLSRIEAGLVEHIGPIARIILKQQLSKSNSLIDLCRELALFIPDEMARANFLRSQRAG